MIERRERPTIMDGKVVTFALGFSEALGTNANSETLHPCGTCASETTGEQP